MDEATTALIVMSLLIFAIFLGFLIWGIKSRQFRNIEEAKYQLFKKPSKEDESRGNKNSPGEDDSHVD
jgi:cbb3-type cytochrome oxidase maturation protein